MAGIFLLLKTEYKFDIVANIECGFWIRDIDVIHIGSMSGIKMCITFMSENLQFADGFGVSLCEWKFNRRYRNVEIRSIDLKQFQRSLQHPNWRCGSIMIHGRILKRHFMRAEW